MFVWIDPTPPPPKLWLQFAQILLHKFKCSNLNIIFKCWLSKASFLILEIAQLQCSFYEGTFLFSLVLYDLYFLILFFVWAYIGSRCAFRRSQSSSQGCTWGNGCWLVVQNLLFYLIFFYLDVFLCLVSCCLCGLSFIWCTVAVVRFYSSCRFSSPIWLLHFIYLICMND